MYIVSPVSQKIHTEDCIKNGADFYQPRKLRMVLKMSAADFNNNIVNLHVNKSEKLNECVGNTL